METDDERFGWENMDSNFDSVLFRNFVLWRCYIWLHFVVGHDYK